MEEKKKTRMYYYDIKKGLPRIKKWHAESFRYLFIKAPNKKAIKEAGVKIVKGPCARNTPNKDIQMGKMYNFRAGDPIEFQGLAVEKVLIDDMLHLKVLVGDKKEVEVYSFLSPYGYGYEGLEIIP